MTSEDKLLNWLVKHRKTLRSRRLTHIKLEGAKCKPDGSFRVRPSCAPSLFFFMAELDLENVSIFSHLAGISVDGMAEWSDGFAFSPLPSFQAYLCTPGEEDLCHRAPWPLPMPLNDYLAIHEQVHPDEWQELETKYQLQH
jgi:hypothetical protein